MNLYEALASRRRPAPRSLGGHAAAAGFTIQRENVAALAEALGARVRASSPKARARSPHGREVDAEVRLAEVDERLAQELAGLGPFGQENPAPLLVTRNARVTAVRRVGDGSHLKLTLEDDRQHARAARSASASAIAPVEVGARVDLAFVPTVSTWQGRRSAELSLFDLAVLEPAAPIELVSTPVVHVPPLPPDPIALS